MKKYLILSNLIPLLLVVYIIKSFIVDPSAFDSFVVFLMSVSFIFKLNFDNKLKIEESSIKDIIAQLEEKVNKKIDVVQKTQDEDRLSYEGKFSTLNLGQQRATKIPENKNYGW